MKKSIIAFISFGILFMAYPFTATAQNNYRCRMCGMNAAKSQTEFILYPDNGHEEHLCCLHCVYLWQKFIPKQKILKLETRDFANMKFINAYDAYYIADSSLIPKGSMAPFLVAFKDKQKAQEYADRYNGNLKIFKGAMEIAAKFDEEVSVK